MSLPGTAAPPPPDDRLVVSAVRAVSAVASTDCPGAEVLGLYAEHALDDDERTATDAHIAGCARCQAIVAAHIRALPGEQAFTPGAAPVAAVAWLSGWRWLVPLASAAGVGVVAVWIGRGPSGEVAERAAAGPAALEYNTPAAAPQVAPSDAGPPATPALDAVGRQRQDRADARAGGVTPKSLAEAPPAAALPDATSNREQRLTKGEAEATPPVAGVAGAGAQVVPAEAGAEAMVPPPVRADSPAARAPEVSAADASGSTAAERGRRSEPAASAAFRAAVHPPLWRVREGRVERSTDNGAAWLRVELPTAETMASVAVREDGTVVATSSTGQVWTSSDRGVTWNRVP